MSDHIGVLPVVLVSPSDSSMVSDSAEERRKFVNSVLSQMDRKYLSDLQQYNRLLMQRNRMLKDSFPDRYLLEVVDMRMAALAEPVYKARQEFVRQLNPLVAEYYGQLSGAGEQVSIHYESDLDKAPLDELLASTYDRDMALRYTSSGVQRDDFIFQMDGWQIRRCGSQGQQKSFLVSLKFAQYEIMKRNCGFAPTLLLDDVFDKLDMGRISNLLRMVSARDFGQIFITDSNKVRLKSIVDGLTQDRTYYETSAGTFRRIEDGIQ